MLWVMMGDMNGPCTSLLRIASSPHGSLQTITCSTQFRWKLCQATYAQHHASNRYIPECTIPAFASLRWTLSGQFNSYPSKRDSNLELFCTTWKRKYSFRMPKLLERQVRVSQPHLFVRLSKACNLNDSRLTLRPKVRHESDISQFTISIISGHPLI